ncbi:DNA helicase [Tanacetum coccineum]
MAENTIGSLKIGQAKCVLEARVYRKWVSKSIPQKKEIAFCCILIDRENNAIQANMDVNNTNYFNPLLQMQMVYRITNFTCENTKPYLQTLENKISLKFGKITSFHALPEKQSEFPEHHFEFVAYNQLSSRVPYLDENSKTVYPRLTDYLGCIRSISDITPFGNANTGQGWFRKVDIENLEYRYENLEQEKLRNRQTLHTLIQQNPETFPGVRFTCVATITSVAENRSWNYASCSECNKKSTKVDGIYSCEDHGIQEPLTYRYKSMDQRQLPIDLVNIIVNTQESSNHFTPSARQGSGQFTVVDILDIQPALETEQTGITLDVTTTEVTEESTNKDKDKSAPFQPPKLAVLPRSPYPSFCISLKNSASFEGTYRTPKLSSSSRN